MMHEVPFGEWLPAQPDFKNPGCVVADNVVPTPGGYGPVRQLTDHSESAAGTVYGAQQFYNNSGVSLIVGGTDTGLFVRRSSITSTGSLTSIGEAEAWDFAQFGDYVIATGANNAPQYLTDIDSDNTWSALTGSPPQGKRCARVGDFLMIGNISGTPNQIAWSSINDPTAAWAASRLTQAGTANLPNEFGGVQRIVGGRYATVFQERGIHRLSYVGPPQVWRPDVVSKDRGTTAPFSVANVGYFTFFLAQDGFYVTNGSTIEQIGNQRVNNWFFDTVYTPYIQRVHSAIDWEKELIIWAFPSSESDVYDRALIYSWSENRWSSATFNSHWMVGSNLDATTLDELDAIYGDLDSIPLSLDSIAFRAGDRRLAAFAPSGANSNYHTFTGLPLEATFRTGDAQPVPGRRVFVSSVQPLIESDTWDMGMTLYMRDNRGTQTTSAEKTCGWDGSASVRGEGQKMAVQMRKPAGTEWTHAQGVQVEYVPAGYR